MRRKNNNGSRAAWARGFMATCAVLAMGLGTMASPAEAAPFAYVTQRFLNSVSVFDTATAPPKLVATIPLDVTAPGAVTVTPDGKHTWVEGADSPNFPKGGVVVIRTAINKEVRGVAVTSANKVAITPNGKFAYEW